MAALNDKFDVIRGWEPGGDASIDQSFPPALSGGLPVTLLPGYIVQLSPLGEVDVATTPPSVALGTANVPPVYVVIEGNSPDFSARFVGKVVCLRGKLTLKTDKLAPAQVFAVGGGVTYTAGLLTDKLPTATTHQIGVVIANNIAVDGTIVVEVDLP